MIKRYTKQDILDTAEDYRELGKADEQKRILEIIEKLEHNDETKYVLNRLKAKIKGDGK